MLNLSALWSGTAEAAGAFMMPFATLAMDQAMQSCSCKHLANVDEDSRRTD
jgi:hypothetical protein